MSSELFKYFSQPTSNIRRLMSILDNKIIIMLTLHTTPNKRARKEALQVLERALTATRLEESISLENCFKR